MAPAWRCTPSGGGLESLLRCVCSPAPRLKALLKSPSSRIEPPGGGWVATCGVVGRRGARGRGAPTRACPGLLCHWVSCAVTCLGCHTPRGSAGGLPPSTPVFGRPSARHCSRGRVPGPLPCRTPAPVSQHCEVGRELGPQDTELLTWDAANRWPGQAEGAQGNAAVAGGGGSGGGPAGRRADCISERAASYRRHRSEDCSDARARGRPGSRQQQTAQQQRALEANSQAPQPWRLHESTSRHPQEGGTKRPAERDSQTPRLPSCLQGSLDRPTSAQRAP